jgi:hypothetical protein
MSRDRLQSQRFELKYIIKDNLALAIRDFVASYLELDEFAATRPDLSYPVHSLYLDSDVYTLYQRTINGNKNRYKLRLRFYENRPGAPVYCEIKSRHDNTISKQRGAIHRDAVDTVLAGQLPEESQMASDDPKHLLALQNFVQYVNELRARPRVHVAYLREAWMPSGGGNAVRVTMDRKVRSCPEPTARLVAEMDDPVFVFGDMVVLELKFTGRFPDWFADLVRVFGLRQTSAAKYVDGVELLEEKHILNQGFRPTGSGFARERARKVRPSGLAFGEYQSPTST